MTDLPLAFIGNRESFMRYCRANNINPRSREIVHVYTLTTAAGHHFRDVAYGDFPNDGHWSEVALFVRLHVDA